MEKSEAWKRIYEDEGAFAGNEKITYFECCKNCLLAYKNEFLGGKLDPERYTCQIYDGVDADREIDESRWKPEKTRNPSYQCPYKVIEQKQKE